MLCWVILYLVLPLGLSQPVPTPAEPGTVGWVQDPNGRGTSGLIISCVLTQGLCVWSAMHLNIPAKGETTTQRWRRSIKWAFLGVLIPELVVLSAWRQWLSARKMGQEVERIFKRQAQKATHRRHPWTIAHSYYAGMGGFVFDGDHLPQGQDALFKAPERLTLTASGVILLAECDCLPDIDRASICDKSKADGLAKALVCIQAAWMIFQTIGRLIVGEPITLLEVNTLAHIFCAFVIYALWWYKPKGVYEPIILEGSWTRALAAYMYMSSRISGKQPSGLVVLSQWIKPELSQLAWYPSGRSDISSANSDSEPQPCSPRTSQIFTETPHSKAHENAEFASGVLKKRPMHTITALPSTVIKTTSSTLREEGDPTQENRYRACGEAITKFPAVRARFDEEASGYRYKPQISHLVTGSATNWPSDYYLPGISGELMGMALWLSSSLYGGIHVAAWSEFFPTAIERQLWRFSATYIASSSAFWFVLCLVAFRWPFASSYWDRFIELRAWKLEYAVLGLGATICGVAYVFARVFLVVDAIASLRQLPGAAYQTPNWTAIFPHF